MNGGEVFRIEHPTSGQGLWYTEKGEYSPFIRTHLTNAKCRDLPMDPDKLYKQEGFAWYSGCDNMPNMKDWFSVQDMEELQQAGFGLYRFVVSSYKQVPGHVIFAREAILDQALLDINLLKQ